jgi:hypothetical protein
MSTEATTTAAATTTPLRAFELTAVAYTPFAREKHVCDETVISPSSGRHLPLHIELSAGVQRTLEPRAETRPMTPTTLITVNALLAGTVVFAIVWLLGSAIRADRDAGASRETSAEPARLPVGGERIAA